MSTRCIPPPPILLSPGEHSFADAVFRLPKIIQPTDNCWIRWRPNDWYLVPDSEKNMYEKLEGEHPNIHSVKPEDDRYVTMRDNKMYEPAYHVGEGLRVTVYRRKISSIPENNIARPSRRALAAAPAPPAPPAPLAPPAPPISDDDAAERERLGREESERIRAARKEAVREMEIHKKTLKALASAAAREQRIRENRIMKRNFEEQLRNIEQKQSQTQKTSFSVDLERTKQALKRLEDEKERLQAEQRAVTEYWARLSRERTQSSQSKKVVPNEDERVRAFMSAASTYFEAQPREFTTEQRDKIARALQKTREAWLTKHDPTHPDFIRRRMSLAPREEQSLPPTKQMRTVSPLTVSALDKTDIGMEITAMNIQDTNPMFATSKIDETVRAARSSRNSALQMSYRHRTSSILQLISFAAIIAALSSVIVFGMMARALVQPRARLDRAIEDVQLPPSADARDLAAAMGSLALANEFAVELDEALHTHPYSWEMTDTEAVHVVKETWCPALRNVLEGLSVVEGELHNEDNSFYLMIAKMCKGIEDGDVNEVQAATYAQNIQGGINCILFNQYEGRFDIADQCPAAPLANSAVAVSNSLLNLSQSAGVKKESLATTLGAVVLTAVAGIAASALTGNQVPVEFIKFGRGQNKMKKRNRRRHTRRSQKLCSSRMCSSRR